MREQNPTFLTVLCCGSLLSEKLKEVIVLLSQEFLQQERDKTWTLFPGTGTEGNYYDSFVGLISGEIGKNNCYATAEKISHWVNDRSKEIDGPIIVVMVTYSRGGISANLACQKINDDRIKLILINIDPVPGIFGHRRMVPPVASNVIKHIVLYAKLSVTPLHLFLLRMNGRIKIPRLKKLCIAFRWIMQPLVQIVLPIFTEQMNFA